jgi:hypothetical protein
LAGWGYPQLVLIHNQSACDTINTATNTVRQTQILSGKFASGDKQKGNFTGYNAAGERIFIHKAQMDAVGFTDANLKFPFFALIATKPIQTRDASGEITDVMVDRLQALSLFKSAAELTAAVNADFALSLDAAKARKEMATAAGLNEASVNALLELA